eukprot:m.54389 g.54389  ORF g.54389 m.54389 type:complete len:330 (+) comp11412_c0_seq1:89-1078(+)
MASSHAIVHTHIPRCKQVAVGRSTPFVYEIVVSLGTQHWTISHRYSEFHRLFAKVKGLMPGSVKFPPKRVVNNKSSRFVEERRKQLEAWLEHLWQVPDVLGRADVREFLQIPSNTREGVSIRKLGRQFQDESPTTSHGDQDPAAPSHRRPPTASSAASALSDEPELDPDVQRALASSDSLQGQLNMSIQSAVSGQHGVYRPAEVNEFLAMYADSTTDAVIGLDDAGAADSGLSTTTNFEWLPIPTSEAPEAAVLPTEASPIRAAATSSYISDKPEDLSFEKGDIITLIGQDDSTGWWIGVHTNGQKGLVPINCLDPRHPVRSRTFHTDT